jgi:transposase
MAPFFFSYQKAIGRELLFIFSGQRSKIDSIALSAHRIGDNSMKPYPLDLRRRVLDDLDAGLSVVKAAKKHSVSQAWIRKLRQRRELTGEIAPLRQAQHGRRPLIEGHEDELVAMVRTYPNESLEGLGYCISSRVGTILSRHTIRRALERLGMWPRTSGSIPEGVGAANQE